MQETTRGESVLDRVLFKQNKLVDNVKMHHPLGSSDHNQMYFNIKVKNKKVKTKSTTGETSKNGKNNDMSKY